MNKPMKKKSKFNMFKRCRTRDGRSVEIESFFFRKVFPIMGTIDGSLTSWNKNGRWQHSGKHKNDLVNY